MCSNSVPILIRFLREVQRVLMPEGHVIVCGFILAVFGCAWVFRIGGGAFSLAQQFDAEAQGSPVEKHFSLARQVHRTAKAQDW